MTGITDQDKSKSGQDHERDKDIHKRERNKPQPDYQKDHPADAPESGDKKL